MVWRSIPAVIGLEVGDILDRLANLLRGNLNSYSWTLPQGQSRMPQQHEWFRTVGGNRGNQKKQMHGRVVQTPHRLAQLSSDPEVSVLWSHSAALLALHHNKYKYAEPRKDHSSPVVVWGLYRKAARPNFWIYLSKRRLASVLQIGFTCILKHGM